LPGLDGVRLGVDLQQQVGDVDQVNVRDVRPVAAAPADVEPDLVLGQAIQRVIDDLDAELQVTAIAEQVPVGVELPRGRELWLVDLHDEARVGDRLVLVPDDLGNRGHVLLL
jgi:hypothetical protein